MTYTTTGRHIVADVYGATRPLTLADLLFAARIANMTVCSAVAENAKQGSSLAIVLAESHLTAHKRGDAWNIDCYTCGGDNDPWLAVEYLIARLDAREWFVYEWERGGNRDHEESTLAQIDDETAVAVT